MLANKRYKMGKPVMDDAEYDELRLRLKKAGSLVILHEGASCTIDGVCKSDLREDNAKTRLLCACDQQRHAWEGIYVYPRKAFSRECCVRLADLPGTAGGLVLACEVIFWTLHLDPVRMRSVHAQARHAQSCSAHCGHPLT